jgi:hypothetical protein
VVLAIQFSGVWGLAKIASTGTGISANPFVLVMIAMND